MPRDLIPVRDDEVITNILSLLDEITAMESIVNLSGNLLQFSGLGHDFH